MAVFAGAWIAAFMLLPAGWVALGLAAWAAVAAPGVVALHRQFQHIPHGGRLIHPGAPAKTLTGTP